MNLVTKGVLLATSTRVAEYKRLNKRSEAPLESFDDVISGRCNVKIDANICLDYVKCGVT